MPDPDLIALYLALLIPMLVWRVAPMLVLKGRKLPQRVEAALGLIPSAAFAALVANDVLQPAYWTASPLKGLAPIAAALIVVPIAKKSGSLVLSALVGVCAYAALSYCLSLAG